MDFRCGDYARSRSRRAIGRFHVLFLRSSYGGFQLADTAVEPIATGLFILGNQEGEEKRAQPVSCCRAYLFLPVHLFDIYHPAIYQFGSFDFGIMFVGKKHVKSYNIYLPSPKIVLE